MMKLILIGGAVLVAFLVALVTFLAWTSDPIDRCLDHGGSWDYEAKVCDFERSHPGPND